MSKLRIGAAMLTAGLTIVASPALAELKVTATIKPIHALVAQVMEGVGTPSLLVQGAASPHTYALKPSDAKTLNNADVVFRVSDTVEPFTRKIVEALPKSVRTVTLAGSPGIELLNVRTGDTFEAHDHAHEGESDHDHKGDHGHDHDDHDHAAEKHEHADDHAHDHESGARDGHVWLDPQNARKMIAEIARVLSEASPADAEKFKANADRATAALDALETEIARDIAPLKGKPYVVFHDAYQYFERRFGLEAVGSITVSPEAQPSAKRLTEIRKKLSSLSAACVFAEPQFKPKLVAAVTEGTKARSGTLDPEGALIEPGPAAYNTLMRNLATGLKACLADAS
ncbi:zinc ABC transporter substrate-binding protein [Hyphomicrobium sp.]|uniref:zinc ABC transporter substrate-binding protein n=1 Tax=Hyphomicrobium sp. TaxID=82 RepID=UPI002E30C7D4|nr:zinc ABC transporter substrate-binding protein [Hyphomicrobium sp.]HEX2842200.1 zinc ABC transporter substrate-binding protein [Hyphomicrobium sp.]